MTTLHQIIEDWFQANQDKYKGWMYDEGMIWKPYHRYWFGVNDNTIESHDKGYMYFFTGVDEDLKVILSAADPNFLEKLGKLLIDYA